MNYEPLFSRNGDENIFPVLSFIGEREKERKKCYKALPSGIRVNELKEEDIFQPVELAAQKM